MIPLCINWEKFQKGDYQSLLWYPLYGFNCFSKNSTSATLSKLLLLPGGNNCQTEFNAFENMIRYFGVLLLKVKQSNAAQTWSSILQKLPGMLVEIWGITKLRFVYCTLNVFEKKPELYSNISRKPNINTSWYPSPLFFDYPPLENLRFSPV